MRIVVITRSVPIHGGGGMERVSWDLMVMWARLGHEVHCVTTPTPGDKREEVDGILLTRAAGRAGKYSRRWWIESAEAAAGVRPDVVVGVSAGAHGLVARRTIAAPIVMQAHGTAYQEIRSRLGTPRASSYAGLASNARAHLRDRRLVPLYSAVVSVGPRVTEAIERLFGSVRSKVVEIPNGVDDRTFHPGVSDAGRWSEPTVIMAGRHHSQKGFDVALRGIAGTSWRVRLAGDGPETVALRRLASRLNLDGQVLFLGKLTARGLADELTRAHVALIPSRRLEGMPLVVLEALACGTPVLLSRGAADAFGKVPPSGAFVLNDLNPKTIRMGLAGTDWLAVGSDVRLPAVYTLRRAALDYVALFEELVDRKGGSSACPSPDLS